MDLTGKYINSTPPSDVEILAMDIKMLAEAILNLSRENDLSYSNINKMNEIIKRYSLIGENK